METIDKFRIAGSIFVIGYGISVLITGDGIFRGIVVDGKNAILYGIITIAIGLFLMYQIIKKQKQK